MKKFTVSMMLICLIFASSAMAARPGSTGADGGTNGPPPHRHHHHHMNRLTTATDSRVLGTEGAREDAAYALHAHYRALWWGSKLKELEFKRHLARGRVRFDFNFFDPHHYAFGTVTVWKSPIIAGNFVWYIVPEGEGSFTG